MDSQRPTVSESAETGDSEPERTLEIAFNPMYSAYDGNQHVFRVPVRVIGGQGALTVSSKPAEFVDYQPSEEGVTLITRRAGKATITITDRAGSSGSATLIVTQNQPKDVEIGAEHYNNYLDGYPSPAGTSWLDGGLPEAGFAGGNLSRQDTQPCAFCHEPESAIRSGNDLHVAGEYTPQQTAGYSDEELGRIFTEGVKPAGSPFLLVNEGGSLPDETAAGIFARFHAWPLATETRVGVIAYLRSLKPKSLLVLDSGGALRKQAEAGR